MILFFYYDGKLVGGDTPTKLTMSQGRRMPPPLGVVWRQLSFFTRAPFFLTHVRLDESKVFFFLRQLKQLKLYKSAQLQKIAFCRGGAARGGNVTVDDSLRTNSQDFP